MNYMNKILALYPDITGVTFWHQNPATGDEWESDDDAYELGIVWDNPDVDKPSKDELDEADESGVVARNSALEQIEKLESEITTRRLMDALAGDEESKDWLVNKREDIAKLRKSL